MVSDSSRIAHPSPGSHEMSPLSELLSEMFDRRLDRIGRSSSQGTETGDLHSRPKIREKREILRRSLAALNPFKNFTATHRSNPAGGTFPTRFVRGEGHEVPRQLDHVGLMIVDDDAPVPKNGPGIGEGVIADGNIELRFGKQAPERPPDLHGLEPRTSRQAAAESIQDIMERQAKGNFHQTRLFHSATELERNRPARPFSAEGGMPRAAVRQDVGNRRERQDVADDRRFAMQS